MNKKSVLRIALAGNPNCGKTTLFNALTGGRAKVGNYPGVTVERKEGDLRISEDLHFSVLDLPGAYSLDARTLDEEITRDLLLGRKSSEKQPDLILGVVDATQLERGLGFILELKALGIPIILAVNMVDLAKKGGIVLDFQILSKELGVVVVPIIAIQKKGMLDLIHVLSTFSLASPFSGSLKHEWRYPQLKEIRERFEKVDQILDKVVLKKQSIYSFSDKIDRVVLHPFWGFCILFLILGFIFQAIFTWAQIPMNIMREAFLMLGETIRIAIPKGAFQSLMSEGVVAGVSSIFIFLPQILLLFTFILVLENSGYMSRAAFLMDRIMGKAGLNGRAFIPLFSSFACAIPGIMATRTIENQRDRLTTILIAPLMTCSARLPVYSLLIASFFPNTRVFGPVRLQGFILFGLYLMGVGASLGMAWILKKTLLRGPNPLFLMELPTYKWPNLKNIWIGLMERAKLFIYRAGTIILSISIILWFLSSYPKSPSQGIESPIVYSYAGKVGHWLEPLVRPIGFNWKIAVALIPASMAREVIIPSLATVYAVNADQSGNSVEALSQILVKEWSVATGLSLLVWYVFASQCFSTLAVVQRETNSWKWPAFMFTYMTAIAYIGSWITYQVCVRLGF